jgi:hypothetical protein
VFRSKFEERYVILALRLDGGKVLAAVYGDDGIGDRFSNDKSFNSAIDLRLKSAGLPISRLQL